MTKGHPRQVTRRRRAVGGADGLGKGGIYAGEGVTEPPIQETTEGVIFVEHHKGVNFLIGLAGTFAPPSMAVHAIEHLQRAHLRCVARWEGPTKWGMRVLAVTCGSMRTPSVNLVLELFLRG